MLDFDILFFSGNYYSVAGISNLFLTVTGITIPSLKEIG